MTRFTDNPMNAYDDTQAGGEETSRPHSLSHNHPAMVAGVMVSPAYLPS